ncbi:MAG: hypothetical protein RL174_860, partial [Actinomycetota bacterium]
MVTHCFEITEADLKKKSASREKKTDFRGSDRHRSGDLTIFSRSLYQLSYRASTIFI